MGANHLTLQFLQQRDRPPTTPRPIPLGADCAEEDNTSRCVPPLVARGNRIPDAREQAMNRSHHLRARADGTSLHCATAFRNLRLHPMDKYEIFRFQTSGSRGATSCERDTVRNALPFLWLGRP